MIILDTHVWIWWASTPRKLSTKARRGIDEARAIGVCAISCWELAMLVAKGRLELDRAVLAWIKQALALPRVVLAPLTPDIAVAAADLGDDFPGDPADRMIVATALRRRGKLITKDRRIRAVNRLETIW